MENMNKYLHHESPRKFRVNSIFWISKTTLIGAMLDLMLGVVEERTGKRITTKYRNNKMNIKEIRGNDQKIEIPHPTLL